MWFFLQTASHSTKVSGVEKMMKIYSITFWHDNISNFSYFKWHFFILKKKFHHLHKHNNTTLKQVIPLILNQSLPTHVLQFFYDLCYLSYSYSRWEKANIFCCYIFSGWYIRSKCINISSLLPGVLFAPKLLPSSKKTKLNLSEICRNQ